uniref:MAK10-like protein n=1 Tax=Tanacetum cinerariifolium TaxID=118510 RepID=A0A699IZK7_TANCI|nr:MAK10-like protein [Tanacetum cinerariifolium]
MWYLFDLTPSGKEHACVYFNFPFAIKLATGLTAKLRNDILMLQQHQRESLSEARTIDQSAGGKLRDRNTKESWALLKDFALYDNESWNDPRNFAKPVKEISLPQDVLSTSDHCLIELENQVQRLMEAHLALMKPTQVNKITSLCEICSGPHDTQYYMENPKQAFVEYASSHIDEARGSVSNLMASQDARFSKFEADFKQQQSEMTNKIDTVLKAIIDRIARALPSDTDRKAEEEERRREGNNPEDTNNIAPNKEQRGLDVKEPLDLVNISEQSVYESLIKEMPKCSLNYDFRIKKGDPRNLKIPCMIGHKFTANAYIDVDLPMNIMSLAYYNSIRKNRYEYKGRNLDPKRSELSNEGHNLLSSRIILSEDDYDIGCRKPSDLEDGFYRDTIKLGSEYLTGMDDQGEVT